MRSEEKHLNKSWLNFCTHSTDAIENKGTDDENAHRSAKEFLQENVEWKKERNLGKKDVSVCYMSKCFNKNWCKSKSNITVIFHLKCVHYNRRRQQEISLWSQIPKEPAVPMVSAKLRLKCNPQSTNKNQLCLGKAWRLASIFI